MGLLRLYRKIYRVSKSGTSETYTLITPTSITAESFVAGTGDTNSSSIIETDITLIESSTGIFYADLNPNLYSSDVTYDLVFYVQYTPTAPSNKKLITRFRIMPFNIANNLDFEISDVNNIDFEININTPIQYEIVGTYN